MRRSLPSLVVLTILAAACSQTAALSPGQSAAAPSGSPVSIASPTSAASPSPGPTTPTAAPPATVTPTTTPETSPPARPSPSASDRGGPGGLEDSRPPDGFFSAPKAGSARAYLGSYCYGYVCADSPFPPVRITPRLRLPAEAGRLVFRLKGDEPFERWAVGFWPARDERGAYRQERLASGGRDGAVREASFQPPPSGDWMLSVFVRFADERGDASYFVRLMVP